MKSLYFNRLSVTFLLSFVLGFLLYSGFYDESGKVYVQSRSEIFDFVPKKVFPSARHATIEEIIRYFRWTNSTSCILTQYFGGKMTKVDLYGIDGQKAMCMDAGLRPEPGKCIIYSFGINEEWSFDDAMDNYECQVYAFDPSMKQKDFNRSSRIHFFNIGLGTTNTEGDSQGWKMRNIRSVYDMLKPWHGDNVVIDYLKADIEMSEWEVIPDLIESGMLDRIKQVGFEVHLFDVDTERKLREKYEILRRFEQHGMVRFDSKGNLFLREEMKIAPGGYTRTGYEIAWYNPKFYEHEYV